MTPEKQRIAPRNLQTGKGLIMTKKLPNPTWTTTVYPDEYNYIDQFSQMVKLANKNKESFCMMDVGKVWGLVLAYKEADAEAGTLIDADEVVPAVFARTLETELTALTAERDQLRDELAAARQREAIAIASWDEERSRALREGERVVGWRDCADQLRAELAAQRSEAFLKTIGKCEDSQ